MRMDVRLKSIHQLKTCSPIAYLTLDFDPSAIFTFSCYFHILFFKFQLFHSSAVWPWEVLDFSELVSSFVKWGNNPYFGYTYTPQKLVCNTPLIMWVSSSPFPLLLHFPFLVCAICHYWTTPLTFNALFHFCLSPQDGKKKKVRITMWIMGCRPCGWQLKTLQGHEGESCPW